MFNGKNHIGRPSNEELKQKRNMKILLISAPALVIVFAVVLFATGSLNSLMGNSITEFYCDEGYELKGTNCVKYIKEKAYAIGDVNRDDKIDISDVTLMQKYFSELEKFDDYQMILADVNKDNKFDISDETILRKHISQNVVGSDSATNYIGQKICQSYYKLVNDECVKEEIVSAKTKQPDNYANSNNNQQLLYGDVNGNGTVTGADSTYLLRYLEKWTGYKLDSSQMLAADVNADGKVDMQDQIILSRNVSGWEEYRNLPYRGEVGLYSSKLIYGDVNLDGKITGADTAYLVRYVEKMEGYTLNNVQKSSADVNADGKVDEQDSVILSRYYSGWKEYEKLPYKGIIEQLPTSVIYGDVNSDGKVTGADTAYLLRYIDKINGYNLNDLQTLAADVNLDKKVDDTDAKILSYHISGMKGYDTLPISGLVYGDINKDGKVNGIDSGLLSKYVSSKKNNPLDKLQILAADVNSDEKVDKKDQQILSRNVSGWKGYEKLPYTK